MVEQDIVKILEAVQDNSSCHQKNLLRLSKIYTDSCDAESDFETFAEVFVSKMLHIFNKRIEGNPFLDRMLTFAATFCANIANKEEGDQGTQQFLSYVIRDILQFSDVNDDKLKHNSLLFVNKILNFMGDVQLDNDLCDFIQETMLERMEDPKVDVILQAILGLCRLQDPRNPECPVIAAYVRAALDPNANIRREVIRVLAPTKTTLNVIRGRVKDVNLSVRTVAFERCATIGPLNFRIVDRQTVLLAGFVEQEKSAKKIFEDVLVPKWLTAYDSNILKFIDGLKLTEWEDFMHMEHIARKLMQIFFRSHSLKDLIAALPIDPVTKLMSVEELTIENTTYFKILVEYLRESDEEMDEYIAEILPELTPFCKFVEEMMQLQSRENTDDSYDVIEYHFQLLNLLDVMLNYDYSDEVGRRTVQSFAMSVLSKYEFRFALTEKLVKIAEKCSTNMEIFTNDMCQLISTIREITMDEPMCEEPIEAPQVVVKPLTEMEMTQRKYRIAELKVKINVLTDDQETAIGMNDFQQAHLLEQELIKLRAEVLEMQNGFQQLPLVGTATSTAPMATTSAAKPAEKDKRNHIETTCRCLDILLAVLESARIVKLTPALVSYRDEFVVPLITCTDMEVHWRLLRCLASMGCVDEPTAKEYAKLLGLAVTAYRTNACDTQALTQSVSAVSDLLCIYGPNVFDEETSDGENNETESANEKAANSSNLIGGSSNNNTTTSTTKRRLYNREEDMTDNLTTSNIISSTSAASTHASMSFPNFMETLLNMLDDEVDQIKIISAKALTRIVVHADLPITSSVLSRIILKWYNPLTVKEDSELQMMLGWLIESYARKKTSQPVFEGTIIPTLSCILNAPRASPLADIEIDNVVHFFAAMMNVVGQRGDLRILVLDLCMKISENLNDRCVPHVMKLMLNLELPNDNSHSERNEELIQRLEQLSKELTDKHSKRNLEKLLTKLRKCSLLLTTMSTHEDTSNTITSMSTAATSVPNTNNSNNSNNNNNTRTTCTNGARLSTISENSEENSSVLNEEDKRKADTNETGRKSPRHKETRPTVNDIGDDKRKGRNLKRKGSEIAAGPQVAGTRTGTRNVRSTVSSSRFTLPIGESTRRNTRATRNSNNSSPLSADISEFNSSNSDNSSRSSENGQANDEGTNNDKDKGTDKDKPNNKKNHLSKQQVKRKKNRDRKQDSVATATSNGLDNSGLGRNNGLRNRRKTANHEKSVLSNVDEEDETVLHSIVEESMEKMHLDQTSDTSSVSSGNSNNLRRSSRRVRTVETETTDSDSTGSNNSAATKTTKRNKKKPKK